jgi:hypothetical protein
MTKTNSKNKAELLVGTQKFQTSSASKYKLDVKHRGSKTYYA